MKWFARVFPQDVGGQNFSFSPTDVYICNLYMYMIYIYMYIDCIYIYMDYIYIYIYIIYIYIYVILSHLGYSQWLEVNTTIPTSTPSICTALVPPGSGACEASPAPGVAGSSAIGRPGDGPVVRAKWKDHRAAKLRQCACETGETGGLENSDINSD